MKKFALTLAFVLLPVLILVLAIAAPVQAASVIISLKASATTVNVGDALTLTLHIQSAVPVAVLDLRIEYDETLLDCVTFRGLEPLASDTEILTDERRDDNCLHLIYLDSQGGQSGIQNGEFFTFKFLINAGQAGKTANISVKVITAGDVHAKALSATGTSLQIPIGTTTATAGPGSTNKPTPSATSTATTAIAPETSVTTEPGMSETTESEIGETSTAEPTTTAPGPTYQPEEEKPKIQTNILVPVIAGTVAFDAGLVLYILKKRR